MNYTQQNSEAEGLFMKMTINNDKKDFEKIFKLFYPALFLFAKKYIEEPHIREDIVQDVFVALWEDREKLIITSSLRKYLIVAVKNNCLNYIRKEKLSQQYMESVPENNFISDSEDDIYTLTELKELLEKALAKLPDKYRIVFELHRFEGKKYEEIAEKLNLSVRTVKRYKEYAIDALKKDLKDYLPLISIFLT